MKGWYGFYGREYVDCDLWIEELLSEAFWSCSLPAIPDDILCLKMEDGSSDGYYVCGGTCSSSFLSLPMSCPARSWKHKVCRGCEKRSSASATRGSFPCCARIVPSQSRHSPAPSHSMPPGSFLLSPIPPTPHCATLNPPAFTPTNSFSPTFTTFAFPAVFGATSDGSFACASSELISRKW